MTVSNKGAGKLTRAERKARRPKEILDAAFEEFVENGFAATRVEDIASRVGVTKGTIYLYFPTKDALFEAVGRHVSTPLLDLRISIDALEGPYRDQLRALMLLAHKTLARNRNMRELLRLTLAEGNRFPETIDRHHAEFAAPMLDAVRTLLKKGIAAGEFRDGPASELPEVVLSSVLHLTILGLMFDSRLPFDEESFIEAHIDLVLNGLMASGS